MDFEIWKTRGYSIKRETIHYERHMFEATLGRKTVNNLSSHAGRDVLEN